MKINPFTSSQTTLPYYSFFLLESTFIMTQDNTQSFDLDSLLDGTLDDLADLPEFKPYPAGTHLAGVMLEQDKKVKNVFYAKLKAIETKELVNSEEAPLKEGDETNVRLDLSNDFGQGTFKKIVAAGATKFGAKSNRDMLDEFKVYVECLIVTTQKVNKKNGAVYTDLSDIMVV